MTTPSPHTRPHTPDDHPETTTRADRAWADAEATTPNNTPAPPRKEGAP
ncbi:hypothetical protein AB0933_30750 [Streptomyces venezuelae]